MQGGSTAPPNVMETSERPGVLTAGCRASCRSRLKVWFIKNYMSPQMRAFAPRMAARYGFDYEFVTYKWPSWLHKQVGTVWWTSQEAHWRLYHRCTCRTCSAVLQQRLQGCSVLCDAGAHHAPSAPSDRALQQHRARSQTLSTTDTSRMRRRRSSASSGRTRSCSWTCCSRLTSKRWAPVCAFAAEPSMLG